MLRHIFGSLLRNYRKLVPTVVMLIIVSIAGGTDFFSVGVHKAMQGAFVDYFHKLQPLAIDLMVAAIMLNIAWLFYKPSCTAFENILARSGASERGKALSLKLGKLFYWVIVIFIVLSVCAAEFLGRFVVGFGVFGAALTLSMQGAANDFICGLLIQFSRKLADNDQIKLEGMDVAGIVTNVGYLSTTLDSEGTVIRVPNREIWGRAVKVFKPKSKILLP